MYNVTRLLTFGAAIFSFGILGGCVTNTNDGSGKIIKPFTPKASLTTPAAQACINAAANKYYLPTKVIKALDSAKAQDGSTVLTLKVDLRDARCVINSNGSVRSVVDTSPKSADQIEAEKAAAEGRIL
ncbi:MULTISPECIES: hypothetical protein [unclassified Bartonella]|uniref:hypothetical protein n=1 Tax=unclassified Bartonella TaxID=2645622 RepID=UPI0015F854E4|nr:MULTISPECIES: hypothetical protein [unclassified Bartonella]UXN04578.1 hypothetical protein N6B01_06095 [Bartonella sp. HY406]UXN07620.1 hypothetical protein N6A79_06475 [Bartonella sp. HY761]